MSNNNLKKSENVDAILSRLKGIYEVKTDIELAKKLGYTSTGALSNWRARGSVNWNRINKYCENVNKEFLTTGEGYPLKEEKNENAIHAENTVTRYESRKYEKEASDKEREILLEYLRGQAESLSEGLRRLADLDKNREDE